MSNDPQQKVKTGQSAPTEENTQLGPPCHQCNCKGFFDPDNDGLCDGFNNVGPTGNACQHPIETHF
jgi:hypothetical protein